MTPQEKAVSLVDWFMVIIDGYNQTEMRERAKRCAIKVCEEIQDADPANPFNSDLNTLAEVVKHTERYWNEVIEQIKAIK